MPGGNHQEEDDEQRTHKRTRRSCDRCTAKKVRCDGAPSCSNCTMRGYQCHYSEKKRTGPKIKTAMDELPELATMMQGGLVPWVDPDRQADTPTDANKQPTTPVSGIMGAAAAATPGAFAPNVYADAHFNTLLTKVEAEYLETFFAHFNLFLPVTDESMVRAAIMRFRAGGHLPVQTLIPQSHTLLPDAVSSVEDVQQQNAQNAILWAAVAIGAMMHGLSSDGVQRYASLAWLSMKECFDYESVTTVAAYLIMAVLYQFFGEIGRTHRYIGLAEEMSKGLTHVPIEMSMVMLFLKAGVIHDLGRADAMYKQLREMEEAPSHVALHRVIHLLTRCKAAVIYNKSLNEYNAAKGLPRVDLNLSIFMDELQLADQILSEEPAAHTSYGVSYTRGFLGVMTFLWHGDLEEAIGIMAPTLDAVARHPGIQRMHPCWHFMHTLGIMLAAAGQYERYDMLQRSQAQVKCKGDGNPVLPPLESHEGLQGLAKFCNHPLCQLVYRHALESTRVATALTPTLDWDRNEPWAFGPKHPSDSNGVEPPQPPPVKLYEGANYNSDGSGVEEGMGPPPPPHPGVAMDAGAEALGEEMDFLGDLTVEQIEALLNQPGDFYPVGVC